jgi:hypothetical protein
MKRIQIPLLATQWPDFEFVNSSLVEKFHRRARTEPGVVSNSGGRSYFENKWLSKNDLHTSQDVDLINLSKDLLMTR